MDGNKFMLTMNVNVKGVWQMVNALKHHFVKQRSGKIINIASVAGRCGYQPETVVYSASKAAVINLTQSQATALGQYNINVNAICPGLVRTPLTERDLHVSGNPTALDDFANEKILLRRVIEPEEIGRAAVFLASSMAKNITGQALNVDGGFCMN